MQPALITAEASTLSLRPYQTSVALLPPPTLRRPHLKFVRRLAAMVSLSVVTYHSLVPPRGAEGAHSLIDASLRTVAPFLRLINMPTFFFLSGLLFAHSRLGRPSILPSFELIKAKTQRLLLPYWAISSLVFPVKCHFGAYALHRVNWSWHSYFVTLLYPWANTIVFYWFLPTLFLLFMFAPALYRLSCCAAPTAKWAATLVLVGLFLNFDRPSSDYVALLNWTGVLHYLLMFWTGIVLYPYVVAVSESNRSQKSLLFGCVYLAASVLLYNLLPAASMWRLLIMNLLGLAAVANLAIGTQNIANRLLDVIGRNTYQIFLFSWFFHQTVILLSRRLTRLPIGLLELASLCLGVLGPISVAHLLRKIPQPRIRMLAGLR